MTSLPGRRPTVVAGAVAVLVVAAALTLSACSGSSKKHTATSAPPPAPTTTAPSSTPAPPKPAPKNPFTGIGPVPKNPVIAVKIDDTDAGRPQVGIDKADIVYIEAVEGGLTRVAAVFGTTLPSKVGYVRSTRPSDPDLLLQFGKITEAYSGGAHDSLPRVRKSGITSWSNDAGAAYYFRSPHPNDHGYINLALDLAKVGKKTKSNAPRPMGYTFSSTAAGVGAVGGATDIRTTVGSTAVEFKYSTKLKKYVRYIDGVRQVAADGKPITATNVIVQSCKVVPHPEDSDVNGNPSQFTYTVGTGAVSVFRGGARIDGSWSRAKLSGGTTLKAKNGKAIPLAPGNSWVALVKTGTKTRA